LNVIRHEFRGSDGQLVAVLDILEGPPNNAAGMVELAADVAGSSYRVRIFPVTVRRLSDEWRRLTAAE
jgi:uncharacterized protein YaaW (UPF0174 family)